MEERHELIYFKDNFPIKSFLHRLGDVPKHWHSGGELLWVMSGTVNVVVNDKAFILVEDDVLFINPDDIHELHSDECTILATQIKLKNFGIDDRTAESIYFNCNSSMSSDKDSFARLKRLVARLIKFSQTGGLAYELKSRSIAFDLISELLTKFRGDKEVVEKSQKYLERLQQILTYINENYQNNLSIAEVADHVHLTVPYFSSFFEKYMGMTFSFYYTDYRLDKAVNELITSDESIESIALKHGFSEVHSFTRAFKKKYSMLPSAYRKNRIVRSEPEKNTINYLELNPENPLPLVSKYLEPSADMFEQTGTEKQLRFPVYVNEKHDPADIKKTFKNFITVGRARELLYSHIQQMLITAQTEIGFEYIKFHGILSDDMLVCTRKNGKLAYSFVMTDKVIDFLLSIGLKPLIQLSFMPKALAKKPDKTLFDAPLIMSEPKDMSEWLDLVGTFTKHLFSRYGKETVESWLFSVWNEPDTTSAMFGLDSDNDFYDLYFETFKALKALDSEIKIGTPSMLLSVPECIDWAKNLLFTAKEKGCMPDFLNIHYYSDEIDTKKKASAEDMLSYPGKLSMDENRLAKFVGEITELRKQTDMLDKPTYITEWNFTLSHRNLINDTAFLSCYIFKNLIDNLDAFDSFGYWSLSDFIEENQPDENLFHGGLGMFTQNGIKKAVYNSYLLANKLKGSVIAKGDGYLVTSSKDKIYIALYNYEHFNQAFASGKIFDINLKMRYTPFMEKASTNVEIPIYDLASGEHIIKEYTVGRDGGSSFDAWVKSGAMPFEEKDMPYLIAASTPNFEQRTAACENGVLIYKTLLNFLDIKVVEISVS